MTATAAAVYGVAAAAYTGAKKAHGIYKMHKIMWQDGKAEITNVSNWIQRRKLKQNLEKTVEVTHNHGFLESGQKLDAKLKSGDIVRIENEVSESLKKKILKKIFGCSAR